MNTTLKTDITVADVCKGFVYNEYEGKGLFGLSGKLTIQPEYQRKYGRQMVYGGDQYLFKRRPHAFVSGGRYFDDEVRF